MTLIPRYSHSHIVRDSRGVEMHLTINKPINIFNKDHEKGIIKFKFKCENDFYLFYILETKHLSLYLDTWYYTISEIREKRIDKLLLSKK